ncbi:hypothetical protein LTR17_005838 [Elasticomyces elasticus]|nr:hypothetical protein LTR17_005838 [Elasticomyces elasticus]
MRALSLRTDKNGRHVHVQYSFDMQLVHRDVCVVFFDTSFGSTSHASPKLSITTEDRPILPSSPPFAEYDISLASPDPSESRGRLPKLGDLLLSPETARLPPRTPASTRSRYRDNSSEYYTAAWGSPYERSTSPTGSARTALSEQVPSEDQLESSPIPSFGLEHLLPDRLAGLSLPRPHLSRSRSATLESTAETQGAHTPRSRTKRWVQLPQRHYSERTQWWSDESLSVSDLDGQDKRSISAETYAESATGKVKGHRPRAENRTLNQRDFLESAGLANSEDMSSLYDSRWAATPPPDRAAKDDILNGVEQELDDPQRTPVAAKAGQIRKATTTPPLEVVDSDTMLARAHNSMAPGIKGPTHADSDNTDANSAEIASSVTVARPADIHVATDRVEVSRLKRRVAWRGKTCVISIPNVDFEALGKPMPFTSTEAQAQAERWKAAGFDTRGFDLAHSVDSDTMLAHARPIYPDDYELGQQARERRPRVLLPDLNKLKAEAERRIEEKLAALGVSLGGDEPSLPPGQSRMHVQDKARQPYGQYPALPFSPPLPTGSAGSMGRPPMTRGHSHTMSVASPIAPATGPYGHMHRHSTFSGSAFPRVQTQHLPQQSHQMGSLSAQEFFAQQPLTFSRGGSPSYPAGLRSDLSLRGPASPLHQQPVTLQSPQDYSRALLQDQGHRQHVHSHSLQQQPMQRAFVTQAPSLQQTPTLPELPEEDDEEELQESAPEISTAVPEPPAYVPPHKRAEINADVAIPTPTRGHQHNISEGFERDLVDAELRRESERRDRMVFTETGEDDGPVTNASKTIVAGSMTGEDNAGGVKQPSHALHGHRKTQSRFNVAAPVFEFNPASSFQLTNAKIPHTTSAANVSNSQEAGHTRQKSSGAFNVAAPPFKPSNPLSMPSSDFSFSAQLPKLKADAPTFEPSGTTSLSRTIIDDLPSIFGKVNIPDIVKPRKSKAVAIVHPEAPVNRIEQTDQDFEDEEGRAAQGDDRLKRQRFGGDDGDEVPRFAEPTPMPDPADFAPMPFQLNGKSTVSEAVAENSVAVTAATVDGSDVEASAINGATEDSPGSSRRDASPEAKSGHNVSSSLSALAVPFEPPFDIPVTVDDPETASTDRSDSVSDVEEGEIVEDVSVVSPEHVRETSVGTDYSLPHAEEFPVLPASQRIDMVAHAEPSFDEIDAVMRHLNEAESGAGMIEESDRAMSPLPDLDDQPMPGVTYLPGWSRSDAPSPSPKRNPLTDARAHSFHTHTRTDSGERGVGGWANVTRLNKAEEMPTSDWSDVLSPPEAEKLEHRSAFFDSHIDGLIGRVVERRLQPLEDSLRSIQQHVSKRSRSSDRPHLKRASSTAESDADDEDELSDAAQLRPVSRGRDKRIDHIKLAVVEAMREHSPWHSQSSNDVTDLHTALANMKVSFARAASASLDLDDIRAVVEDVLRSQADVLAPLHKRDTSELEGKLQETLAGALEEANVRRVAEERAAETHRMLRLAEEELALLRDASRDEDHRLAAMQDERRELLDRCEKAEDARKSAEEHARNIEAENEALQGTLEEYRTSSSKWRHDVDDGQLERAELEATIADLERQVEEANEYRSSMGRRLENLHADMATAAGQLASEKAMARASQEKYRARCETLEAQQDTKTKLHDHELHMLRAELVEQTSLTTRYESEIRVATEASQQAHTVRSELAQELHEVRAELNQARADADIAIAKHARTLEAKEDDSRHFLRKVHHEAEEARQKLDNDLQELTERHDRALHNAIEDKERSEYILNERLDLADAKLRHAHDRISHLEERLEVAKSAAQAAATSAQSKAVSFSSTLRTNALPEKVSPQALRESILVLQEQLQDRESQIERLQSDVETAGDEKLRELKSEITWLRELLAVRSDDLTDLISTLARPTFDRDVVRDIAIRIRANLQMEQQEKERFGHSSQSLGGQALAGLTSFATPKASSLTSAFNKWRSTMESSSLRSARQGMAPARSSTPTKSITRPAKPANYMAGLMTPPASTLRQTPSPEAATSLSRPLLESTPASESHAEDDAPPDPSEGPTTPLLREQSYDMDAEDSKVYMQSFEDDDDLDVSDTAPPAFRSLKDELGS